MRYLSSLSEPCNTTAVTVVVHLEYYFVLDLQQVQECCMLYQYQIVAVEQVKSWTYLPI